MESGAIVDSSLRSVNISITVSIASAAPAMYAPEAGLKHRKLSVETHLSRSHRHTAMPTNTSKLTAVPACGAGIVRKIAIEPQISSVTPRVVVTTYTMADRPTSLNALRGQPIRGDRGVCMRWKPDYLANCGFLTTFC